MSFMIRKNTSRMGSPKKKMEDVDSVVKEEESDLDDDGFIYG